MAIAKQSEPRKIPRATIIFRRDGDTSKKIPTGFSSTISGLQNYWHSQVVDNKEFEHQTPSQFCEVGKFRDAYETVIERYQGIKKKSGTGLAKTVGRLTKGDQPIDLVHILAFSEHVGLPAGLFVLFCELVDLELKTLSDTPQDMAAAKRQSLAMLRRARKALEALEAYAQADTVPPPFTHIYNETSERINLARCRTLKTLADAYRAA